DLDAVVAACLDTVSAVTEARYTGLYLAHEDGEAAELRLRGRTGERPLAESLRTWARPSGAPYDDVVSAEDVVSLAAGGRAVGALVFGGAARRQPMFLTTLAATTAVAVQNAQRLGRE